MNRGALWQIALRVRKRTEVDHLGIVAGGVAFWSFLALIPGLGAALAVWGLIVPPGFFEDSGFDLGLPEQGVALLSASTRELSSAPDTGLTWGLTLSLLIALWVANSGTRAIIEALNLAYNERERRSWLHRHGVSLALTLGIVAGFGVAAATVVGVPTLLGRLGLETDLRAAIRWLRWPLLVGLMLVALGVLYRFGPARRPASWRWLSPGAVTAALAWTLGSAGFSIYVEHFASYDEIYGSLGAVAITLLWLYITAFVVLLGAEINAEFEHQTRRDSTVGETRPLGEREAYHADNVAQGDELDEAQTRAFGVG